MIRDRVAALKKKGMTLEQVRAARPTLDFDGRYGATTARDLTRTQADLFLAAVRTEIDLAREGGDPFTGGAAPVAPEPPADAPPGAAAPT